MRASRRILGVIASLRAFGCCSAFITSPLRPAWRACESKTPFLNHPPSFAPVAPSLRLLSSATRKLSSTQLSCSADAAVLDVGDDEGVPWWEDRETLPFSCTSCGKCCQCRGSAWLSPEEAEKLADHFAVSVGEFEKTYCKTELDGWMELKRVEEDEAGQSVPVPDDDHLTGKCVFLDAGNQCTVYDLRPVHCRVFPFFPATLSSMEAWNEEAVQPDPLEGEEPKEGLRLWSKTEGGCEGMRVVEEGEDGGWVEKERSREEAHARKEGEEDISVKKVQELQDNFLNTYAFFPVDPWRWFT